MNPDLLSRDQLLARKWSLRKIDAALDEADEFGESEHWLNTTGKPLYSASRVAIASYRTGLSSRAPTADQWAAWASDERPTSLPLATFRFHRLAHHYCEGVAQQLWSLRISHPVLGRRPGTKEQEKEVLVEILSEFIGIESRCNVDGEIEVLEYLADRGSGAGDSLGWSNSPVLVRPARLVSYLSQAVSLKALARFLDVMSLVQNGRIKDASGRNLSVIDLLIASPSLRFDNAIHQPK